MSRETKVSRMKKSKEILSSLLSKMTSILYLNFRRTLQSMRHLVDLKNIIAKQLPKMPRAYIVKLIMDR